ncbi:large ribosomal subunit protein mL40 [Eucyclogobius newberryi]|uniref:large ribosomal subunit protein mL40 n=1 Tax=Eucyclogobius newberryi TaxID=166745 RepID=UPI003B5B0EBA
MSLAFSRCIGRVLPQYMTRRSLLVDGCHAAKNVFYVPAMTLRTTAPLRTEPKKKKKVDPKREQMMRERLKKKLKKLEKVPPELIPIEDFITPAKCMDEARTRSTPVISFEESERRALLLKEWSRYKQEQHMAEMKAVESALEAQREALEELRITSEELYQAALKPDFSLLPFTREGPAYTPPKSKYEAPDGKYNDTTRVYTQ